MHQSPQEQSGRGPMSPCISVCALDAQGYCSGCLRTRDEVAGWMRMSPAEQWDLVRRLERRHVELRGVPAAAAARLVGS
jgi:predicted Fe-S protein YdhL (DUF1289 family)